MTKKKEEKNQVLSRSVLKHHLRFLGSSYANGCSGKIAKMSCYLSSCNVNRLNILIILLGEIKVP